MYKWLGMALLTLGMHTAQGAVVDAAEQGFSVRYQVELSVAPPSVWAALSDIARWWDPEHTYSGDARNMSLEPTVHGCFCEKLGLYGAIAHMTVLYAEPARSLRLSGALGPLQEFAVTGSMTWTIEPAPRGARLTMTYVVGGYADRPLADWAPIVDEVLGVQVRRLSRFIDQGDPAAAE